MTISQSYRQSPGSARREPEGNPVTQHGMYPNSTTPQDILGWDMHKSVKLMKQSQGILAESRAGKSRKHRPEPQGAYVKTAETDQVRCKAIQVEPPLTPWAPTEPNACGDAPAARATTRKGRISSAKTRRERGDNANGIDKRDRCKEKAEGTLRT